MTQDNIYHNLIAKGFPEKAASILAEDLSRVSTELRPCLNVWLESGREVDFSVGGFSIRELMRKYQLQYPAALLSIDWVIKEPAIATAAINKGVR